MSGRSGSSARPESSSAPGSGGSDSRGSGAGSSGWGSTASRGSGPGSLPVLVGLLAQAADPVLAYKARIALGLPPGSTEAVTLQCRIAESPRARALLGHRNSAGTIPTHPYKKWQGPHWTLVSLALIDYPPGDDSLRPLFDQVHRWLLPRDREPVAGRVRNCASQEGNAIWYSLRLGLDDERTERLADRLIRWQWPDGGWNCDRRPAAASSSFQETAIPMRALHLYGLLRGDDRATEAAARAAELLLSRRLLWRRTDGALIAPDWGGRIDRIHFPIQFYDVLFALQVMAEVGRIGDERCRDAMALLMSKRGADGGFPLEEYPCVRALSNRTSRGTYADWGPAGRTRSNPFVSLIGLEILRMAGAE